jgi:hypothetical protein
MDEMEKEKVEPTGGEELGRGKRSRSTKSLVDKLPAHVNLLIGKDQ